ncbi:MAG: hypothetical protein AAF228_10360, partial [Pseudomonadota bacterium]
MANSVTGASTTNNYNSQSSGTSQNAQAAWSGAVATAASSSPGGIFLGAIKTSEFFRIGDALTSKNGVFTAELLHDGTLTVRNTSDGSLISSHNFGDGDDSHIVSHMALD